MKESISRVVVGTLFVLLPVAAAPWANSQSVQEYTGSRVLPSNPQPAKVGTDAEPLFAPTPLYADPQMPR